MRRRRTYRFWYAMCGTLVLIFTAGLSSVAAPAASGATSGSSKPAPYGELDCNGASPVQKPVKASLPCTDIRGIAGLDNSNVWNSRFYDNNTYIGHDEPDLTFLSNKAGTGNNVTWTETLGQDPTGAPTVGTPGSDTAHWFELSIAPWFSMAMCDPNSYPQASCIPNSDSNAPTASSPGGGSAFMEMQFYPPGFAPFADSISCDNTHWCAALTIDSLECTGGFAKCNANCIEPVNFAFIQTDGVPTGPPSPQLADLASFTPNDKTLLMNPGDTVQVHMYDAPAGSSGYAFEVVVNDLTTGQSGYMQASEANGFQTTSMGSCSGTPFNFQPEYSTASASNYVPWAAIRTDISTEFETGHFTPCTSVAKPFTVGVGSGVTDTSWSKCISPYETGPGDGSNSNAEASDAFCYPKGDTHGSLAAPPDTVAGCLDDVYQNGDLDFDGSPYWAEWPTGASPTATFPGSFVQQMPSSSGSSYAQMFMQSDVALSESTCSATTTTGCTIPPPSPGNFYPYWSQVSGGKKGACSIEFGNVSSGSGVNDFGGVSQYGTDQIATLGYPEFIGPTVTTSCSSGGGGSSHR